MKIKLNYWQTIILFIPCLLGWVLSELPHSNLHTYHRTFLIANFLLVSNILIVLCYQAFMGISFNNTFLKKSNLYNINALIPVVFFFLYLLFMAYYTFIEPVTNSNNAPGPLRKEQLNATSIFILLLNVHAAITFFFINNQFISKRIKTVTSLTEKEILKTNYLNPMKILVRVSIFVLLFALIISVVIDLSSFRS